jgi:hypothetical protein
MALTGRLTRATGTERRQQPATATMTRMRIVILLSAVVKEGLTRV